MKALISTLFAIAMTVAGGPVPAQAPDIRTFVRQLYIEGVPYNEVTRFDPASAVPILLEMLADPKEEKNWPNIVAVLGMLGDERVVDPLIEFLKQAAPGPLSHPHYIAKTGVVMTLGYVINKSGSAKALAFLMESVDPDIWTQRELKWSSPYHRTEAERNRQLTAMSILGMGLSGHPQAAKLLRSLRQAPTTAQAKSLRAQIPGVDDVLNDAIKANERIGKRGLAGYHR